MDQSHIALNQTISNLSIYLQSFMDYAKKGKEMKEMAVEAVEVE